MTSLRIFKAGFSVLGITILSICLGLTVLSVNTYAERSTPVTVVNPSNDPVPVVNTFPREPVNFTKLISCDVGAILTHPIFTVPDDKRLVIETVSVLVAIPVDDEARFGIHVLGACTHDCPNFLTEVYIPLFEARWAVTTQTFVGTQSLRMYAEPGDSIGISLDRLSCEGPFWVSVNFSGYLLPLDSPTLSP